MNCLYLAHRVPYPPNKGDKLRAYHQIKNLLDHGVRVTVLCPVENETDIVNCKQLQSKHHNCIVHDHQVGSRFIRYLRAMLLNCSISESHFYSSSLLQQLRDILAKTRIDAVLCTASSMAPYVTKTKVVRSPQTRTIMDFMDLDSEKWKQYAKAARLPMRIVYLREAKKVAKLENLVAESFDAALLVSDSEKQLFEQSQPNASCSIISLGNGIDPSEFHPPQTVPDQEPPHLFFAGVMDYAPNYDAVLWFYNLVWPSVKSIWPEAKFTIAGMNPTQAIQALATEDGIEVTGYVDDILPYFHRSSVFVAPFRIARGVQNKILQAMACGLPVITTSMGAEGIRYQDGFNLFIADSADGFLRRIQSLTQEPLKYQEVRKAALATIASHYSWTAQLAPLRAVLGL